MNQDTKKLSLSDLFLGFLLPLLAPIYLVIFSYATNATLLNLNSMTNILVLLLAITLIVYSIWVLITKKQPYKASLAAFSSLVFFLSYGRFHSFLTNLDLFRVRHLLLVPFVILLALAVGLLISKIKTPLSKKIWLVFISLLTILVIYNVARIIPVEIQKHTQGAKISTEHKPTLKASKPGQQDIYWLVFDEFAGLDVMRDYFKFPEIDRFKSGLEKIGFRFVEGSKSKLHYTLHQIATRLNYQRFPTDLKEIDYYPHISNNKVVNELKSRGYAIAILDETRSEVFGISSKPEIPADVSLEKLVISPEDTSSSFLGPFGMLVARHTMLAPLKILFKQDVSAISKHQASVLFVADELGKLDLQSPKFVYTHLLLPHKPFMFAEDGSTLDPEAYQDWNYYFGQYKFTMDVINRAVKTILENADPENPPIIIIQSDHGARNLPDEGYPVLENYDNDYIGSILYAVYAPMCPDMPLKDGIDPINTFPLVFNCLFDTKIPLQ